MYPNMHQLWRQLKQVYNWIDKRLHFMKVNLRLKAVVGNLMMMTWYFEIDVGNTEIDDDRGKRKKDAVHPRS